MDAALPLSTFGGTASKFIDDYNLAVGDGVLLVTLQISQNMNRRFAVLFQLRRTNTPCPRVLIGAAHLLKSGGGKRNFLPTLVIDKIGRLLEFAGVHCCPTVTFATDC